MAVESAPVIAVPEIPASLLDRPDRFEPSQTFRDWAFDTFITDSKSPLYNREHDHLAEARIGFLLTTVENVSGGVQILGQCQLGMPNGKKWSAGRQIQQLEEWFGFVPDFLITLDAVWMSTASPFQVCALVEHELLHANFKKDEYGDAKRNHDDEFTWEIRPHDAEVFTTEIRRYGAWKPNLEDLKTAFASEPQFGNISLGGVCGCGKRL